MQYRQDRNGTPLSILGFGCMRFTRKGSGIDLEKAEQEIMEAFRAGVNYFDTAYLYPGSEALLGTVMERNGIRDQVYVATKLPQYLVGSVRAAEQYFQEELRRLRTDHVDYYLLHHLTDAAQWERLKGLGLPAWIAEKKASGAIRNIGFSYHGNSDNFLKILQEDLWDFCQIQYNYLDETTQAGVTGLKAAAERGLPVIIMEPLRGGRLVQKLPPDAQRAMRDNPRGWTPAEWAFRWLFNQPEVTVVLSGMNSLEMVRENVAIAGDARPGAFTEADFRLIDEVRQCIRAREKVGCTGCRYCMPCPQGVDIPGTFSAYNAMFSESRFDGRKQFGQAVALTRKPAFPSQCVGCGKCEKHCPQSIPIREKLREADRALEPLPYRIAFRVLRKFMVRGSGGTDGE